MSNHFVCPSCAVPRILTLENIERLEMYDHNGRPMGKPPTLQVTYTCECTPIPAVALVPFRTTWLDALFGPAEFRPELPWENPLRPTLTPREIDVEVATARFDLSRIESADEFLRMVDGHRFRNPRHPEPESSD